MIWTRHQLKQYLAGPVKAIEFLVLESLETLSKCDIVFLIEGAWDCAGFGALLAFETCFRDGMVKGPAAAGFVVC
jgi:hypothetical protein